MNDRDGHMVQPPGWTVDDAAPQALHVITLVSSTAPLPLQAPKDPALAGLAVFRSRRVEDGRERFRLHIGYFPSAAAAEQLLPLVRTLYPMAFAAPAPQANLGSLEDTGVARFSILKPIEAGLEAGDAVPAVPPPQPASSPPPPTPVLGSADVVVKPQPAKPAPEEAPAAPAPEVRSAQRYAVQLVWSKNPIDLSKVPDLAIFGGYLLYAVETETADRRMYGVRLGFYADALSARLVAQYVRSDFKGVAVVPVSDREIARASTATIRLSASRTARGSSTRVRWPAAALSVEFAPQARVPASAPL
jgi:hypothetical protein